MHRLNRYRVYATGTHCAVTEIHARNAEEAVEIARGIDGEDFDVLHLHSGDVIIRDVELVGGDFDIEFS